MTRSFYNETGFNFATDLAEEYYMQAEPFQGAAGMEQEIKLIKEELDCRPTPSGYKKLELSSEMDKALKTAKILGNELTQKVHPFLNSLIEQDTQLTQEARQIKDFIYSNDKSFLY